MRKFSNNCLRNENLVTYGAMFTLGKTGCSTCRSNCNVGYLGVTESIDRDCFAADFALANYTIKYIIVGALIFTIGINVVFYNSRSCCMSKNFLEFCAAHSTSLCSCTSCICACCVSKFRYYFLCNEDFVTYGTMLTCGKTCLCTCGSYCHIDYFGVTESVNCFLCNEDFVTYGTVLTFCETGCGTCGSYCLVNYLGVTESIGVICYV